MHLFLWLLSFLIHHVSEHHFLCMIVFFFPLPWMCLSWPIFTCEQMSPYLNCRSDFLCSFLTLQSAYTIPWYSLSIIFIFFSLKHLSAIFLFILWCFIAIPSRNLRAKTLWNLWMCLTRTKILVYLLLWITIN